MSLHQPVTAGLPKSFAKRLFGGGGGDGAAVVLAVVHVFAVAMMLGLLI